MDTIKTIIETNNLFEHFEKKYPNYTTELSLVLQEKFIIYFNTFDTREEYKSLHTPSFEEWDDTLKEFAILLDDLQAFWEADSNANGARHVYVDSDRRLEEIKRFYFPKGQEISLSDMCVEKNFELYNPSQIFALIKAIFSQENRENGVCIQYVKSDIVRKLLISLEASERAYAMDFRSRRVIKWTKDTTLYTREEVMALMEKRKQKTHQVFFDRYNVKNISELDNLVKSNFIVEEKVENSSSGEDELYAHGMSAHVLEAYRRLKRLLLKEKGKESKLRKVLCFYGKSGTGKSILARYLSKTLFEERVLSSNAFLEVSASELSSDNHALFEKTMGGIVYINGLDTFTPSKEEWLQRDKNKIITDLVGEIERVSKKSIIILGGEKIKLEAVFKEYPSLASLVTIEQDFNGYTKDDLKYFARLHMCENKFTFAKSAEKEIEKIIDYNIAKNGYGNVREFINSLNTIFVFQADRVEGSAEDNKILLEDVKNYEKKCGILRSIENLDGDSHSMLNRLIGLNKIKTEVLRFQAYARKHKEDNDNINLHMAFFGNPGVGKTEVGKIIAKILYEDGILPENKLIYVTRNDLVAEYVGQTAPKTRNKVMEAMGGVLFIDEAYALAESNKGGNDFGKEAISELVSCMEEYRGKFMVIFAGYKNETERLFEMNSGLKSRINHQLVFEDYSIDELKEIMELMITANKYEMDEECKNGVVYLIKQLKKQDDFANARAVRNILEKLYEIQALRTIDNPKDFSLTYDDFENLKQEDIYKKLFVKEDIEIDLETIESLASKNIDNALSNTISSTVLIQSKDEERLLGEGTGFFISEDGLIATNEHVIHNGTPTVIVTFKINDNQTVRKTYECKIVKKDAIHDLAIIQIQDPEVKYPFIPLFNEDNYDSLIQKEFYLVGYPLGGSRFKNMAINNGYVQSYNKDSQSEYKDIDWLHLSTNGGNPGNSGSAVVTMDGKCIGIYSGGAVSGRGLIKHAIPTKYLWDLISETKNTSAAELSN